MNSLLLHTIRLLVFVPRQILGYPGFIKHAEKHGYVLVAPMGYNNRGSNGCPNLANTRDRQVHFGLRGRQRAAIAHLPNAGALHAGRDAPERPAHAPGTHKSNNTCP